MYISCSSVNFFQALIFNCFCCILTASIFFPFDLSIVVQNIPFTYSLIIVHNLSFRHSLTWLSYVVLLVQFVLWNQTNQLSFVNVVFLVSVVVEGEIHVTMSNIFSISKTTYMSHQMMLLTYCSLPLNLIPPIPSLPHLTTPLFSQSSARSI